MKTVSERFGYVPDELIAKGRTPDLVMARQVVMYVLWRSEGLTLEQIGKVLGGRTPATISWGVQQIGSLINVKPKIKSVVEALLIE